jgi:uncharacterized membrane protein
MTFDVREKKIPLMRTRLILILLAALWCLLIVATPILASGDGLFRTAGGVSYAFFSRLCHQWDTHSFHLCGEKFPVCIRCTAIYAGFLAGILLYQPLGRRIEWRFSARTIFFCAAAGMVLDVTMSMLGIADSTTVTRLVTGGIFGVLAAFVLTPILHELIASFPAGGA